MPDLVGAVCHFPGLTGDTCFKPAQRQRPSLLPRRVCPHCWHTPLRRCHPPRALDPFPALAGHLGMQSLGEPGAGAKYPRAREAASAPGAITYPRDSQALLPGMVEKSGSAGTEEQMEQMFLEVVVQAGPAPDAHRVSIGREEPLSLKNSSFGKSRYLRLLIEMWPVPAQGSAARSPARMDVGQRDRLRAPSTHPPTRFQHPGLNQTGLSLGAVHSRLHARCVGQPM